MRKQTEPRSDGYDRMFLAVIPQLLRRRQLDERGGDVLCHTGQRLLWPWSMVIDNLHHGFVDSRPANRETMRVVVCPRSISIESHPGRCPAVVPARSSSDVRFVSV